MDTKIRGIQYVPSIMKIKGGLQRRVRSQYEMFNELAQLGREEEGLNKEKKNWQERIEQIHKRLEEIGELQESLQQQIGAKNKTTRDVQDVEQAAGNEKREVVVRY